MEWIIDFCANCGTILPEGGDARCGNCSFDVLPPQNRLRGRFSAEDAQRLYNPPDLSVEDR